MAISAEQAVEYRIYAGYVDPRYPMGTWWGKTSVLGNGTGGNMNAGLVFHPGIPSPPTGLMWSLEQVSIYNDSGLVNTDGILRTLNFGGPQLDAFFLDHFYRFLMQTADLVNPAAIPVEQLTFLPLFLGSMGANASTQLAAIAVNTDTVTMTLEAEGYWWGVRSINADGGPQRPPTGLYRT